MGKVRKATVAVICVFVLCVYGCGQAEDEENGIYGDVTLTIVANDPEEDDDFYGFDELDPDLFHGDPQPEPRLILDAEEIAAITISYNSRIPIHAILNNEEGYEEYFDWLILSNEDISELHPFFGTEGYYISKVPIYWFDAYNNAMDTALRIVLFSEDLSKAAEATFFIVDNELQMDVKNEFSELSLMTGNRDMRFIFLYNRIATLVIDSNNNQHLWPQDLRYTLVVRGDYFHTLNHELLGVSFTRLTNPHNMIWVELSIDDD
jgi:hypothetical protein